MNSFWITLIEINLLLSVVYAGYILLLKNLTFFRWTRVYLLGGMLTGLVYPFLKTQRVVAPPVEGLNIVIPDISQVSQSQSFDYGQWIIYAVSATFLLLFLRFLIRFFSLGEIHFASDQAEFNGRKFRNTHQQINPFSFWKWIYIHRESHSDFEMNQIMAHEYIHTRERHTLDVLLAEICTVICWYNPLVRLLSKSVKDNLEFLTDAEVLYSGIDKLSYQHSLVGISLSGFTPPRHGNHFAFKTLKKRIRMMNKEESPRTRLLSYMLLSPLVLALAALLTFSCQKETLDTIHKGKESEGIAWQRALSASNEEVQKKTRAEGVLFRSTGADPAISFEAKSFEADNKSTISQPILIRGGAGDFNNPLYVLDGKEISDLSGINPENIHAITVLKDKTAVEKYGEKAKNGVIEIHSKKSPR